MTSCLHPFPTGIRSARPEVGGPGGHSGGTTETITLRIPPAGCKHEPSCGSWGRKARVLNVLHWPVVTPISHGSDFDGRVALITGAARGLGRAATERLIARGASVAVNVRDQERADALARELGDRAYAVPGDVTDADAPDAIVKEVLERFGRLDILVNNAAYAHSTRFDDLTADEWRRAIEVNLTAPFLLTKAVVPSMKAHRYGRIVNISSLAGKTVSTLGGAHYTASKAGLQGLTRAAAKELGPFGITVNAICPGMIDTELTREHATEEQIAALAASYAIARLGTAEEVADLICFVASEAAGYITGASYDINGGDLMM